ncbi:hypothetical protein EIP86_007698 [Pleurotus ostreatoroseus]|nr:hypothetical protein EIP86_007698 [Pleurotus ostreatoroseus]
MSLPAIGAQCSLENCNLNDFLPIRCRCDLLFCKDHISPEAHACRLLEWKKDAPASTDATKKLERCAADKCTKPSLEAYVADSEKIAGRTPAVCPRCTQAFCATHREPASHACTAPDPTQSTTQRNAAGRALLSKLFPGKEAVNTTPSSAEPQAISAKRKAVSSTNPKKAAQMRQVELMKMRHKAQPGDPKDKDKSVPLDQKLHVKVHAEGQDEEKIFWFRKSMGTGKALDLLAPYFRLTTSTPLYLTTPSTDDTEDCITLKNDQVLSSQVEDGAQLVLSRSPISA